MYSKGNEELLYKVIFPSLNKLVNIIGGKKKILQHEWYLEVESTWPTYRYISNDSTVIPKAYFISQNFRDWLNDKQSSASFKKELDNLYKIFIQSLKEFPEEKESIILILNDLINEIRRIAGEEFVSIKIKKILSNNKDVIRKINEEDIEENLEIKNQTMCSFCRSYMDFSTSFFCKRCKISFCHLHRLPESHNCSEIPKPIRNYKGDDIQPCCSCYKNLNGFFQHSCGNCHKIFCENCLHQHNCGLVKLFGTMMWFKILIPFLILMIIAILYILLKP